MKVLALSNVKHDQVTHPAGKVFDINDDAGAKLIKLGVVRESTREDELVAEAKAKARAEEKSGKTKPAEKPKKEEDEKSTPELPENTEFEFNGDTYKANQTSNGQVQHRVNGRLKSAEVYNEALKAYQESQE
jgi:hypothetical protein